MKVEVGLGVYVLAVSGGVDSMVLLDLLARQPGLELITAHFNHGIRADAARDEALVKQRAAELGLPFEVGYGGLGAGASEETARDARYAFLKRIQDKYRADAIITAHHQDDMVETALINLLRGTGRKGLASIANNPNVLRPLLNYPKVRIYSYARHNSLKWNEDQTNEHDAYLRNYLRNRVIPRLTESQRQKIISNIEKVAKTDIRIDDSIATLSQYINFDNNISRSGFAGLPADLGNELVAFWLRRNGIRDFDRKTVNRLSIALRTAKAGTVYPAQGGLKLLIGQKSAKFSATL